MRLPWRRHALLFVIPGGSGGFPPINVDLYRGNRAFRDSIECTGAIIEEMLGWTAAAAYRGENETSVTPALARRNELVHHGMTRIALIDRWSAEGVVPDGAIGVSLGEVIAPYAVGAISREDCARLVAVLNQAVTQIPSAHRVYVVALDADSARRLCRKAPVPVDFLGTSTHSICLVMCREDDSEVVRAHFAGKIVQDVPSGWRYHTPGVHFDSEWARQQLGNGVVLRPTQRPIYSPAVGGLLPGHTRLDARFLHWTQTIPAHFANAVSAALADGFDAFVQIAAKPMNVFAGVTKIAEAEGRCVRELHSIDANALAVVRRMRRRPVTPAGGGQAILPVRTDRIACPPCDPGTERMAERLLQPLLDGLPFDIVSALADPIADAITVDRDELRRVLASSVLLLLRDAPLRQRVTENPELLCEIVDGNETAIAALRAMLRLAPDFAAFQPLETVRLDGEVLQLMVAR